MRARITLAAVTVAAALAVAGCSSSGGDSGTDNPVVNTSAASSPTTSSPTTSAAASCSPSTLKTHSSGTLTVATDSPAYEPWFVDNKPANGKGFESAVAYAVAKQLGYSTAQVKWTVAPFNSVIAPTPKKYDFDINEVSITTARAKAVDFSSGYYDVAQAVVMFKKDKYSSATTIAGLKGAKLGAQQGTTSFAAIGSQLKTGKTPGEFPTNDLAVQALKNGQIDGLVVDLPTGLYLTSAELSGAKIVGQLPVTGKPEQFGLVLDKGSSLTSCVTKAVDSLRADGTLATLQQTWLTSSAGAPELK
ncbi:ABC transporter substrate-binding protein [Jatrophihabitans sp.]|uniref:ABC transporter substrate-binding protein n=1 Tax=Jatrophihabitans sp. TaxID=1932789 RepID=UPI0030C6D5AF|nr:hypothetical protein [Jatrophihabitans sp.]